MRLTDDARQCVVFLGWQKEGPADQAAIDPKGTGFFVSGGVTFPGQAFLVTAKHVAENLHTPFVVRLNKKGGGAGLFHVDRPTDIEWCFHKDKSVDLAVAAFAGPSWAEARGVNAEGILSDLKQIEHIDAGSPVCVIGLFHLLHGTRRNLPITHVGHVAMLPGDELIPVDGTLREGYLVQANAISGCSGSPVFTVTQVVVPTKPHAVVGMGDTSLLLGVWSASWKVRDSKVVAVKGDDDQAATAAPLGMGVVTPLQKLVDIIWSEDMQNAQRRLRQRLTEQGSATPDAVPDKPALSATDENPQHREGFTSLLRAAAQKPKPTE